MKAKEINTREYRVGKNPRDEPVTIYKVCLSRNRGLMKWYRLDVIFYRMVKWLDNPDDKS